jgi:hypothetical protein
LLTETGLAAVLDAQPAGKKQKRQAKTINHFIGLNICCIINQFIFLNSVV